MQYELYPNPHAVAVLADALADGPAPIEFHRLMPGYERTPLWEAPQIAHRLGVARVLVKDESARLGLPSFKMLGASWATACAVRQEWLGGEDALLSPAELRERIPDRAHKHLAAATDGNHGRGVARMAQLLGVACTIFVPAGTAPSRIAAIESEGAAVIVVDGSYDDAIAVSATRADENTIIVSDTSWEGYARIPAEVVRGYSTLFREVDEAMADARPTVVAFQAGVGAFAAAGLAHYRSDAVAGAPRTVIVEPTTANCLLVSARAGALTAAPPPHPSTMAGLNCGLPSQLAWPVIEQVADVFLAIDDHAANEAMRVYAASGILSGESGAASLGGLLAVADSGDAESRALAGLHAGAVILLVNTEGATDPANYGDVVGLPAEEMQRTAALRREAAEVSAL